MPKIDTISLRRPEVLTESRTILDPQEPDKPLELTFAARPDYSELLKVEMLAERHKQQYAGPGKIPIQVGGKDIEILPALCVCIATVQTVEQPQEWGRYTFEDWARMSVSMSSAFDEAVEWAKLLLGRARMPATKGDGSKEVPNA